MDDEKEDVFWVVCDVDGKPRMVWATPRLTYYLDRLHFRVALNSTAVIVLLVIEFYRAWWG